MTHASSPASSPMTLLRSMMQSVDGGIEDAIDAHGFSLSALTADEAGVVLTFAAGDAWHLALTLPPDGHARVALRRGDADLPGIALTLTVADGACRDLASALGIAMELFTAVAQP